MLYTAAFNVVSHNAIASLGNLTLSTAGETNLVIPIANIRGTSYDGTADATTFWVWEAGTFHCVDHSPFAQARFRRFSATTWAGAVDAALKASATSAGWAAKIPSCTWSKTTGFYTFAVATVTSAITWSAVPGRSLFGFAGNSATASSHTSAIMPTFVISPTLPAVSDPSLEYEPSGIGGHVTSDTGEGFGISRYVSPLYRDWLQQFETKAKTVRLSADESHPWTFQHQREHCRGAFPFVVYGGGFNDTDANLVFSFRDESIALHPERATPGNDAQFHIGFQCVAEGYLTS